jgi:hypothetical protein
MVGILGNILAGGVAGGAKNYTDIMDDRIEDKREAAKQAALEKRMKSLARYNADIQRDLRAEGWARDDKKEETANRDAWAQAELLYGEEKAPGLLGEYGGDEYSVPGGTRDEIAGGISGKALLATKATQRAMEKEEKSETREDELFELTKKKTLAEIKKMESGDIETITMYHEDGSEIKVRTKEAAAKYAGQGFSVVKPGSVSASEKKRLQEESDGLLMGMIPGFDPEAKTAMVEKEESAKVLDALKRNGYPGAKIVDEKEDKNMIMPDGPTMVTISAGRFDHTAIGDQEAVEETGQALSAEAQSLYKAYESKDISVLDKMSKEQYRAAVMELAGGDRIKAKQINDAFRQLGKPGPEDEPGPGILASVDYTDRRSGDPLAQKHDPFAPAKSVKQDLVNPALDVINQGATNAVKRFQRPNRFQ